MIADDDGAGARIDDHARRRLARLHLEVLQQRDEGHALVRILRPAHVHRAGIQRVRHVRAQHPVDPLGHMLGGGEIGTKQVELQLTALSEGSLHAALDDCPVGDAPRVHDVDRDARAVLALGAETADDEIALGERIHLAVDALQGRQQQRAAEESNQETRVDRRQLGEITHQTKQQGR